MISKGGCNTEVSCHRYSRNDEDVSGWIRDNWTFNTTQNYNLKNFHNIYSAIKARYLLWASQGCIEMAQILFRREVVCMFLCSVKSTKPESMKKWRIRQGWMLSRICSVEIGSHQSYNTALLQGTVRMGDQQWESHVLANVNEPCGFTADHVSDGTTGNLLVNKAKLQFTITASFLRSNNKDHRLHWATAQMMRQVLKKSPV